MKSRQIERKRKIDCGERQKLRREKVRVRVVAEAKKHWNMIEYS